MLLGMSQEKLGEAIGLTFQQVQKYERGANRIGASRLYDLAQVLDVQVQYFYDEMEGEDGSGNSLRESQAGLDFEPMSKRETLELVRAYYKITDKSVRSRLFELVKALGRAHEDPLPDDVT